MRRRTQLLALASLVFWPLLGLAFMAWGFHTTHVSYGRTAVQAGQLIGSAGVVATLLWVLARRK